MSETNSLFGPVTAIYTTGVLLLGAEDSLKVGTPARSAKTAPHQ